MNNSDLNQFEQNQVQKSNITQVEQSLDEVNFSDQSFPNLLKFQDQEVNNQSNQTVQEKRKRDVGILTSINRDTVNHFYRDASTTTQDEKKSESTQLNKQIKENEDDDDYDDEDDDGRQPYVYKDDGFEITGLEKFLDRVIYKFEKIIKRNIESDIFQNYEVFWDDQNDILEDSVIIHRLDNPYDFIEANNAIQVSLNKQKQAELKKDKNPDKNQKQQNIPQADFDDFDDFKQSYKKNVNNKEGKNEERFQVTAISWSSNGAALAVAYGKTDHSSWCEHVSVVSVWSLFRRDFDAKKPDVTIEANNCLSTIQFHPENPLILAGGSINGEIYIWNVEFENKKETGALICKSEADEYFHREPITQIIWLQIESLTTSILEMNLVSISTDGKILFWNEPLKSLLRYPIKGHMLARIKNNNVQVLGGTALSLVKGTYGLEDCAFLVGTEGGMIQRVLIKKPQDKDVRHFLTAHQGVTWSEEAFRFLGNISEQRQIQKIKDHIDQFMLMRAPPRQVFANHIFGAKPVISQIYPPFSSQQSTVYEKHFGPVLSTSPNPFNQRLFLTGSADGSIRLYDIQDKRPVAQFEPSFGEYILCVQWSPVRAAVFAAVSNAGTLYIYDLVQSKQKAVQIVKYNQLEEDGSSMANPAKYRQAQQVQFNPKQRSILAVAYHDKLVRVFRLSRSLSYKNPDDMKALKSFLQKEIE